METAEISLKAKKQYTIDNSNELQLEDKREICTILTREGKGKNIIYNKDGVCVNLDIIDEATIHRIYMFIKYKMEKINTTF